MSNLSCDLSDKQLIQTMDPVWMCDHKNRANVSAVPHANWSLPNSCTNSKEHRVCPVHEVVLMMGAPRSSRLAHELCTHTATCWTLHELIPNREFHPDQQRATRLTTRTTKLIWEIESKSRVPQPDETSISGHVPQSTQIKLHGGIQRACQVLCNTANEVHFENGGGIKALMALI